MNILKLILTRLKMIPVEKTFSSKNLLVSNVLLLWPVEKQRCIPTPSTRKGFHAESKASHGRKQRFFSNVLNSLVFYCTWFRKPNYCVQTMSEQYLAVWFFFFSFSYRGSMRRSQIFFSEKKTS